MSAPTERVPVHDLEAEACVLSAVMLEPFGLDRAQTILRAEHFYSPANRRIWEACVALQEAREPIDVVTVRGWLRSRERLAEVGGDGYLGKVVDAAPSVANLESYARTVHAKASQRAVVALCQRIAAEGYGDVGEVREWAVAAEEALSEIARSGTEERSTLAGYAEVIREVFEPLARREASAGPRAHSGLPALDRVLSCHEGDLVVLAGRPGMGKSAVVGGWATHVGGYYDEARGECQAALVFSAEMPRAQFGTRAIAAESRVPLGALRTGNISDAQWATLTSAAQTLGSLAVFIDDRASPTVLYMRSIIKRVKRTLASKWNTQDGKPTVLRLVVLDYLQIAGTKRDKNGNREQEISTLTRELKALAKQEGLVVIALSQLNRAVEQRADKRPTLADLRESGAIEQDADSIVFVYRDEYYNRDSTAKGRAELLIAKQRNGPAGAAFGNEARAVVGFEGAYTMFRELTAEEERQLEQEGRDPEPTPSRSKRSRYEPRSAQ